MARRDDDLKDSFYLYIMRNSIGAGLRSEYAPNGHMPDRLAELMQELEAKERRAERQAAETQGTEKHNAEKHAAGEPSAEAEDDQNRQPASKQSRKR